MVVNPKPIVLDCGQATTDGTGQIVLSGTDLNGTFWQVVQPDGSLGKTFRGDAANPILPQASGWTDLAYWAVPHRVTPIVVTHQTMAPDGTVTSSTVVSGDPAQVDNSQWDLAEDPAGGSIATIAEGDRLGDPVAVIGQRFDAAGVPLWDAIEAQIGTITGPAPAGLFVASGISTSGESLSLWGGQSVSLVWRDRGGASVAEASGNDSLAGLTDGAQFVNFFRSELHPLLDGSLALRIDGRFRRVFPHLAKQSAPLPPWLSARATWSFRVTRGGMGYALLSPDAVRTETIPDCMQTIELVARSGRVCGRITLHAKQSGEFCASGVVDQGWDGTVVQQRSQGACSYAIWPRMLAR